MVKLNNDKKSVAVAIAGQPNAGKTSLFNALTGALQHVGNYPGVTVERRQGKYTYKNDKYEVVDLPGTYSLSSFSPDERVAQTELLENTPDVVIVVVDSTTLTRSLVFLAQILHLGVKTVLCLNMADEARAMGQVIDVDLMSDLLGCPVLETQAHRRVGVDKLKQLVAEVAESDACIRPPVLGKRLTEALETIARMLEGTTVRQEHRSWIACKLLLNDAEFTGDIGVQGAQGAAVLKESARLRAEIEEQTGDMIDVFVAGRYHGFAHGLETETMRSMPREDARALSDAVDRFLVHKVMGLPVFMGVMYAIFWVTFTVGEYPMVWIESGFSALTDVIASSWPSETLPVMRSLALDGIIAGVGGVLIFLPNIVLLFFGLALLEGTGYMARAAFLMDHVMHRFGLHGKSFLPLITGFGCSIPGIMATRTLENERDRLVTMLVLPLMSCGARLPIWMLLVPAFFVPSMRAPVLGLIYLVGILLALGLALLLRKTILKGEETPFVMELPPYRFPTMQALFNKMFESSWLYLQKAGTVILAISILMWFVTSYPKAEISEVSASDNDVQLASVEDAEATKLSADLEHSFAGRVGRALEPVFRPLGFDWKLITGMVGAFAAKELFVAQMGIVHSLGEVDENSESLRDSISREYSPAVGISLILFLLISTPCMATVAVTKRESGSWKWALLQFSGLTTIAYMISFVAYHIALLFGLG